MHAGFTLAEAAAPATETPVRLFQKFVETFKQQLPVLPDPSSLPLPSFPAPQEEKKSTSPVKQQSPADEKQSALAKLEAQLEEKRFALARLELETQEKRNTLARLEALTQQKSGPAKQDSQPAAKGTLTMYVLPQA